MSNRATSNTKYSPIHQFFFDVKVTRFTCIVACIEFDLEADGREVLAVGVRSTNTGVPDEVLKVLWRDCERVRMCCECIKTADARG
jgi:hypothetical protein